MLSAVRCIRERSTERPGVEGARRPARSEGHPRGLVRMGIPLLGLALLLGHAGTASAGIVTFYGLDLLAGPGGSHPYSDAARVAFLSQLDPTSVGVEDFEDNAPGSFHRSTHAVAFPSTGVAGTIVSRASYADEIRDFATKDVFPISGTKFYSSHDRVGNQPFFDLTLSAPVTAFGFYGISFSDYLEATVPRSPIALSIDGGMPIDVLNVNPNTIPGASVNFFGLISDVPFTTITLFNTPTPSADLIGLDDIIIGARPAAVPEPGGLVSAILAIAAVGCVGARRCRSAGRRQTVQATAS